MKTSWQVKKKFIALEWNPGLCHTHICELRSFWIFVFVLQELFFFWKKSAMKKQEQHSFFPTISTALTVSQQSELRPTLLPKAHQRHGEIHWKASAAPCCLSVRRPADNLGLNRMVLMWIEKTKNTFLELLLTWDMHFDFLSKCSHLHYMQTSPKLA